MFSIKVPPQKPVIMDQTGQRVVGSVLGPLSQGQTVTLDCLVTGGNNKTAMINATNPSFP